MSLLDRIGGWFGRVKDRVGDLVGRIKSRVSEAAELGEAAGTALLRLGDKVAALEPQDIAWLTGPVTQAVIAAQQSALISAAVGPEKLEAVRLALAAANKGLALADDAFDARWAKARPYIDELVGALKDRRQFGFSHGGQ